MRLAHRRSPRQLRSRQVRPIAASRSLSASEVSTPPLDPCIRNLALLAALVAHPGVCQSGSNYHGLGPDFTTLNGVRVNSVTRDATGAIYAVGQTAIGGLATPGAYQTQSAPRCIFTLGIPPEICDTGGFIAKLSPDGQIVWATYLGGTTLYESDTVQYVALDSHGNVWVSGQSGTLDFPTTPNAYQPAHTSQFLAELSPDGSRLLYSTFTTAQLLAIGPDDTIYLGGSAALKFSPSANQVIYNTPIPFQAGLAVLDSSGTLYLGGAASSSGFPITAGVYSHPSTVTNVTDIGLAAISPDGAIVFSTVIGGPFYTTLNAMTLDNDGNLYLAGYQEPPPSAPYVAPVAAFPVTGDAIQPTWKQGFLLKLPADASTLLYATFLGNGNTEGVASTFAPLDLKIGQDGKLRMIGDSGQYDIPLTPNAFMPCGEPYYIQFSSDLRSIEYATAIPWSPFYFDATGNVYVDESPPPYFGVVNVTQSPAPGPTCVGPIGRNVGPVEVAPGLLVSILGVGIGPEQSATFSVDAAGGIPTEPAGTQIFFDGIPAPILATGPYRIDAVVPFGLATGAGTLSVYLNGEPQGSLQCGVTPTQITLFTHDGTGAGAVGWNQDGTPNSASNPAHAGDIVSFYGTGAGPMTPTPIDGFIPQAPQSALSLTPVPVYGGLLCTTTYAGDAPGEVEGIFQYNCRILGKPNFPFSFYLSGGPNGPGYTSGFYSLYVQ